eukprot:gene2813-4401_t
MSTPRENCRFHHVQIYVKNIQPMEKYKEMETHLNSLAHRGSFDPFSGGMRFLNANALPERVREGRRCWLEIAGESAKDPAKYVSHDQDVVEQLIIGAGWRVTAEYIGKSCRSVLVCSNDPCGVKMIVTCPLDVSKSAEDPYEHFKGSSVVKFFKQHADRQGVAVLGFEVDVGTIDGIFKRYQNLHPLLLASESVNEYNDIRNVKKGSKMQVLDFGSFKCFDVYAYYKPQRGSGPKEADSGTVIRFSERSGIFAHSPGWANPQGVLPGFADVPATFDGTSIAAYNDHWVSNVVDRKSFLATLEDTVGFTPKVVFEDQSQVYLPINNALSEVGHVHGFIAEMGQGVQHMAMRVKDLVSFIERVNNYRKITGQGFMFLRIPRSYYGRLAEKDLIKAGISESLAADIMRGMVNANLMTNTGVVNLDLDQEALKKLSISADAKSEFEEKFSSIAVIISRARYNNLWSLLRDNISEGTYLQIVQNQILVDIQGQDILYQIFTANILQEKPGAEAPFFEFIQRVCSASHGASTKPLKIRPGCGGFGIRNFLTLFLSIEVSKAMLGQENAVKEGNAAVAAKQGKVVDALASQLDESNPILTNISDAMTAEADELDAAAEAKNETEKKTHLAAAEKHKKEKEQGSEALKVTSDKYKAILKAIRESLLTPLSFKHSLLAAPVPVA